MGGGTKSFHPFKGGAQTVLPCLGGRAQNVWDHFVAPPPHPPKLMASPLLRPYVGPFHVFMDLKVCVCGLTSKVKAGPCLSSGGHPGSVDKLVPQGSDTSIMIGVSPWL